MSLKRFLGVLQPAPAAGKERQADRDARVDRIQIYPGDSSWLKGHVLNFAAVAYDKRNVPIGGLRFNWTCDSKGRRASISPLGEFVAQDAGVYTVSAVVAGKQARVSVTVTDRMIPTSRKAHAQSPPLDDWNDENRDSAFDPRNRRGNPPTAPTVDGGSSSGNFQLVAPVLSLPGRGMDLNLSLTYNSRVWNKAGTEIKFDIDRGNPAPGWSIGLPKLVSMGDAGDMLVDPDGTRHPFAGTRTVVQQGSSTYGVVYDLHTTDGTFIKYRTSHGCSPTPEVCNSMTGFVYYPDGRVVTYNMFDGGHTAYPAIYKDRHDNYMVITYSLENYADPRMDTITDTLGRVITFHYDTANRKLLTAVTAAGLPDANGNVVNRTLVRIHYRDFNLLESGSYGFAPTMTPVVRNSTVKVIDAIYYPGTKTGYWFGDTDSFSSYGMLRKVVEQRDMAFTTSTSNPLTEQGTVTPGVMSSMKVYNYPQTPDPTLQDAPTYTTMSESWASMDVAGPIVTNYLIDNASNPRVTKITGPDGNYFVQNAYNYSALPNDDPLKFKDGLVFETKLYDANQNLLATTTIDWEQGDFASPRARRIEATDEIGQKLAAEATYGPYNQITELREFGYNATTPRRITKRQYEDVLHGLYGDGGFYNYIVSIPKLEEVYAGDGTTRLSRTEYYRDEQYSTTTNYNEPIAGNTRWAGGWGTPPDGNITRIVRYADAANLANPITEIFNYDIVGNVVKHTTLCSNGTVLCAQTSFTFNQDTQRAYAAMRQEGSSDAGSGQQLTMTMAYDFNTGLPRFKTDANGRTSEVQYSPETWRPTKMVLSTGASMTFAYNDAALSFTKSMFSNSGAPSGQSVSIQNGLGQLRRSETLVGAGIWDAVEVKYDAMGRSWKESKPFRTTANPNETKWTETFYDSLGRVYKYQSTDGSLMQLAYNESPRPQGASSSPGRTVKSKDAWNRERWVRLDADDQIVEVVEPNPNGDGSVSAGGFVTTYSYDVLSRLIGVTRGNQQRTFKFDSLGRLTHQKLAEASATLDQNGNRVASGGIWSDVFFYDDLSNLTARVDARGVKTSFSYRDQNNQIDLLNRLRSVSYDTQGAENVLPSPPSTFSYMSTGDVSRLLSIASGASEQSFDYDVEGRLKERIVTFAGHETRPMKVKFLYDSFNRVSDTYYPDQYGAVNTSRKFLHRDYDIASRLSAFKIDGVDNASAFVYNPASQIESLKIGPSGPNQITQGYQYGPETGLLDRQTVVRGSGASATTLLDMSYDYTRPGSTARTGQLTKVLNNLNHNRDRGYSYDALGRLKQATGGPSTAPTWTQTYSYDIYGNRTSVSSTGYSAKLYRDTRSFLAATDTQKQPVEDLPRNLLVKNNLTSNTADPGIGESISDSPARLRVATANLSSPPVFEDDPLGAGMSPRSLHITQLRDAINQLRAQVDLPPTSWAETVSAGVTVKATHITEMRTSLNAARNALGLAPAAYTDPELTSGYLIKAIHIQELRDLVKAAWNVQVTIPRDGVESLSYDDTSNRITSPGFTYDAAGNLTHIMRPNGSGQSLQYDAAGRLIKVKNDNNQTLASYTYNHGRQRIITQTGNETSTDRTYYVWGAGGVIAEYVTSETLTSPTWSKNYVYLGRSLLATHESAAGGESTRFHHSNQLNTRIITDPSTGSAFEQTTLPFGTSLSSETTLPTNRPFAGYDRSAVSELDYAVNRDYDSFQGRFTTVDPLGMQTVNLMDPQSLNLYSYCGNDPINFSDPTGTSWFSFISFFFGGGSSRRESGSSSVWSGLFSFGMGLLGTIFQRPTHILGQPFLTATPARAPSPPPPPPIVTFVAVMGPQNQDRALQVLQKGLERIGSLRSTARDLVARGKVNLIAQATEMALEMLFGNIHFHAGNLNPTEVEFAKEVSAFERRSFQGRNVQGIDGFLHDGNLPTSNPRPIQLQQNAVGGMRRIIEDAENHQHSMKQVKPDGLRNMALYVKYTGADLDVSGVLKYLDVDGQDLGLIGMSKKGTISDILIFTNDGVVRITNGNIRAMWK